MKVIIASDSFKGSLFSMEVSQAITLGIKEIFPKALVISFPLADGGEGTVEALVAATNGQVVYKTVTGPLGDPTHAMYGIAGDGNTAVIEVAAACGLPLLATERRNPLITTTYGVGELILDAIEKGCRDIVIGLGGSGTNDAGVGMLQALGFQFLDKNGEEIGFGGGELQKIFSIHDQKVRTAVKECTFRVACDVKNPLHGTNGAAYVFAPQKGAAKEMVSELDEGLRHFAEKVSSSLHIDVQKIEGAGAAGGLGAAFAGFLNGKLQSGIELVLSLIHFEEELKDADFVITGEGKLDGQTSMGKTPLGVAKLAKKYEIPVIALAGSVTQEAGSLHEEGITAFFSIVNEPMNLGTAMDHDVAFANLKGSASQIFRLIKGIKG
ncbi:glycerate kinase [Bacillus sp. 03113]|uniref:glycerate kinase family protein n=1 Tax=Bacillus sp. 03113 TaxID=2578211 RepID=UPI001143131B|nr:glycerate kinase [Bacillus sp. 03113]